MDLRDKIDLTTIPSPIHGDIVVYRFNMDKIDLETANDIHNQLAKSFPQNKVIGVPLDYSIDYIQKEEFIDFIKTVARELEISREELV